MRKLTYILCCLFLAVASCCTVHARTIRACFYESPGCHEIAEDGTRSGYGYDFMEALASKAGWEVEYVGYDWPWDKVLSMLEKGELDIVDFVTYKPDRAEKMLFSKRPMAYSGCAIKTTADRAARYNMATIDDWGHIRVGVMKGDVTEKEFCDFADDYRLDYKVIAFDTEVDGVEAMRRGEIDLVAFEELVSFPDLVLVEICKPFADHIVTRKDNPALMQEIDTAMAEMDRDMPGWMTRMHQKYFQSPTVYAYVPAKDETNGPIIDYLHVLLTRLDEVLARNIEIRECRADFSDADFSKPSFACGITFNSENLKRFRFPLQSAGSRRVDLLALPDDMENIKEKLQSSGIKPFKIGYLKSEGGDLLKIFSQYAQNNSIAYEAVPCEHEEELQQSIRKKDIDLVLCHSGKENELKIVKNCGFVDFYLAPTTAHPELPEVIDKAFKYLRLDDPSFIYDLESRFFGIDNDKDNLVTLGAYVESGLSVRRDDGYYDGFVIDFMTEIARRADWHMKIMPLSFSEAQRALADGTIDVMGAAVWTSERAKVYDYSQFNMGPLCYALMKRRDGRMLENRPDTWNGAKIGFQHGSLSVADLENFFSEYGVTWEGVPFNDLKEGEKLVRARKLDAVYTLAHEDNRDLVPLMMLPTKLCYFCTNKQKPWLKEKMDSVTEELLRENPRWISDVYERHLANSRGLLFLSKDEINYVNQSRGHRIKVSFLDAIEPVIFHDSKTGEVKGLARNLFDRISENTGLEFEYLIGDCKADVLIQIDGTSEERSSDICVPDWYKMQVCRVRRREPIPSAKGTVAIMKNRSDEIEIARKNGATPIILESRKDCYQAVRDGRVEYMVDILPVAMKWLDVEKRYNDLYYQRVDTVELSRGVMLCCPTMTDPRLRSILAKARDSRPSGEADAVLFETLYGGSRPLSMKVKSALLTSFVIILIVAALLFLTHQHLRVARSANLAKTNFLFNMSHDIRTPMNAILGFTAMGIKHIGDQQKVLDCLNKTQQAGNLLLMLINNVLDMSRIEAGHAELQENPGDVTLSFINIESAMHEIAKSRDVTLTFDIGEIQDRYVFADFTRCTRVFTNLISNAIKYNHEGGYVKVICEQVSPAINGYATYRYIIEDNGIGMSDEFQRHMFESFAREHNSTTSGIQGTGLGLSVCKTFVEAMNGTIECKSTQGKGTTFTIILPFKIQDSKKYADPLTGEIVTATLETQSTHTIDLKGRRVLLVEDNELNREIAEEILVEEGLVVDEAEDGSQAVELLKQQGPEAFDFILMDIQMPVMNGYDATKAIRTMYPDAKLPIIALSANAFAEDKQKSLEAGMNDHVAKPVKIKELLEALSKFM